MNLSLYKYSAYHSMSLPTIYIPKHILKKKSKIKNQF